MNSFDCWVHKLKRNGFRPTRQRLAIAKSLFGHGDRHVNAEMVHAEVNADGNSISLATVYNTLNQFTESGLLRQITIDSHRSYFDTNMSNHHHYYMENTQELVDIPSDTIEIANLPDVPEGMEISHVDVVVRLRAKDNSVN